MPSRSGARTLGRSGFRVRAHGPTRVRPTVRSTVRTLELEVRDFEFDVKDLDRRTDPEVPHLDPKVHKLESSRLSRRPTSKP